MEQRRANARSCLFYKVVYGLVAVPLPDYVQLNLRISRYAHSLTFRKLQTSRDYYKYSCFYTGNTPTEYPTRISCQPAES